MSTESPETTLSNKGCCEVEKDGVDDDEVDDKIDEDDVDEDEVAPSDVFREDVGCFLKLSAIDVTFLLAVSIEICFLDVAWLLRAHSPILLTSNSFLHQRQNALCVEF
ncbi:MAG: hypothetical protein GY705_02230 [Bacteroidetes bacterium]|nr:hypothetical protein [Bacteroidota bacterium]